MPALLAVTPGMHRVHPCGPRSARKQIRQPSDLRTTLDRSVGPLCQTVVAPSPRTGRPTALCAPFVDALAAGSYIALSHTTHALLLTAHQRPVVAAQTRTRPARGADH